MSGRAKAEAMMQTVEGMTVAGLVDFVQDQDAVKKFLLEFKAAKVEFQKFVDAQAKIDQIEKLLLQAKHQKEAVDGEAATFDADRTTALAEIKGDQASAKKLIKDAEAKARGIVSDGKLESKALMDLALQANVDAKAAVRQAGLDLEAARQERDAAEQARKNLDATSAKVRELVKALGS